MTSNNKTTTMSAPMTIEISIISMVSFFIILPICSMILILNINDAYELQRNKNKVLIKHYEILFNEHKTLKTDITSSKKYVELNEKYTTLKKYYLVDLMKLREL